MVMLMMMEALILKRYETHSHPQAQLLHRPHAYKFKP